MRNRGDILDDSDIESGRLQCAQGGFSPGTRAFDVDFDILDPMFHRLLAGNFGSYLCREGGALAGTLKSLAPGTGPRKGIAACIRDRDNGVIEG